MNRIIIIGASGHGRVVADIAKQNGYEDIVFLDRNTEIKENVGYPVLGTDTRAYELEGDLFVAIGNSEARERLMEQNRDRNFPILIHPSAIIADNVKIGSGSVVMAGAVINPGTEIGKGCIINTASSVDHDCHIGNYCHVAGGVSLSGSICIGDSTWIGTGATVSNNVRICSGCMIGVGGVVIKDIDVPGKYVGVPVRKMG